MKCCQREYSVKQLKSLKAGMLSSLKAGMLLGMFPTLSLLQIKYLLELAKGNTNVVSDLSRQWRKLVPPFLSTSHCKFYGTRT